MFNDGSPVTAADVVATIEHLVNPDNKSNALSAFGTGKLSPGGTTAVDDNTVLFTLDGPMGNFPYIVSSDNYNGIILPASATDTSSFATAEHPDLGSVDDRDVRSRSRASRSSRTRTTGALRSTSRRTSSSSSPICHPRSSAFQAGDLDVLAQFSVSGGEALLDDPEVNVIELPSTAHRQIHMRTSKGPFADKRVRQAMAMAMNRPDIIQGLFEGKAEQANDSPFFSVFPSTGTPKERTFDLDAAKALMAEAAPDGFDVTLHSWETQEIPDLAVLVQNAAKEIGINITIAMSDDYYDNYWVAFDPSIAGSDHRHHRLRPPRCARRVLGGAAEDRKGGVWNAAEYANPPTTRSSTPIRRHSTCRASRTRRRRSRSCCWTRRADHLPVQLQLSCRPRGRTSPAS